MSIISTLKKLEALQVQSESPYYERGLFPSQRFHLYLPYHREDDNIFFSASICFGLMRIENLLTYQEKEISHHIQQSTISNYPAYESLNKPDLYNFYRTNPPGHYPYGMFLSRFGRFQLPTDADDTVMIHMTKKSSRDLAFKVKKHLIKHANHSKYKAGNVSKEYQYLNAYSIWFGSPKMPIEFDFCVLCNVLYFVRYYELPWSEEDEESLKYIVKALKTRYYLTNSFQVSYIYPKPAIMLYHVSRLMQDFEFPHLKKLKDQILTDICLLLENQSLSYFEKLLLQISGLRLGLNSRKKQFLDEKLKPNDSVFFYAPMFGGTKSVFFHKIAALKIFQILYTCEAFGEFLKLEHRVLSERASFCKSS